MPKDRNLTYSDRQAQAARDKKLSAQKKVVVEKTNTAPAPTPPKAKGKR
jgi:hypothetical protein